MANDYKPSIGNEEINTFSRKNMSDTEKKFYSKLVNQSFFYRGHPAGFVVALTSYFGLQKTLPFITVSH